MAGQGVEVRHLVGQALKLVGRVFDFGKLLGTIEPPGWLWEPDFKVKITR